VYFRKQCPITLRTYLVKTALERTLDKCKDSPADCGFDVNREVYQSLKLVRIAIAIINDLILELQDNAKLYDVPLPPTSKYASELVKLQQPPKYCIDAIKNSRRTMEDRHIIIDDFNSFYKVSVCMAASLLNTLFTAADIIMN